MTDQARDRRAELFAEVLKLSLVDGLSARAIAKRLGISRNSVRKLLGRFDHQTRRRPAAAAAPRASILAPYHAVVKQLLDETPELKAPTVLERVRGLGYTGGLTVVRDLVRRLRPRPKQEAYLTLSFLPGAAMQVDWADFGFCIPGCPRRVSALVMALCHSRYLYLEFTLSQDFGTFVRALERGLRFYGGTTMVDIFDNMKTVVRCRVGSVPVFNPRFLEYARARGFAVVACNPNSPEEKGRVERPIGFVRGRFWPGRRFISMLDLNTQAVSWRDDFANNREHEETGKVPALVYAHEEKARLNPLPTALFETDDISTAGVTKLFRVRFDRNTYSVPPRLVGQMVVVRASDETVSMFLGPKRVALHPRCWGIAEDIEEPGHRALAIGSKPRALGLPLGLSGLGVVGVDYFRVMVATRRSLRREIVRLTFLCEVYGDSATASAMQEVMKTGHVGCEYVEYVMRHKRGLTPQPAPLRLGNAGLDALRLQEPDLASYDDLVCTPKTLDPGEPPDSTEQT